MRHVHLGQVSTENHGQIQSWPLASRLLRSYRESIRTLAAGLKDLSAPGRRHSERAAIIYSDAAQPLAALLGQALDGLP
jgi:hypothetical protein